MPKPKAGETRKDFMMRCIPEVIKEGKSKEQAVAICSSYYERKILDYIAVLIGLLLTPIWLPITLITYFIKKWRRKRTLNELRQ